MEFKKIKCFICNEDISEGGAAFTSHARMHVRKGEAVEHTRNGKLVFIKAGINITDTEPYAKLGNDPLPGQPKEVWELPEIKTEFPEISPYKYFETSGEAVKKADKLLSDLYSLTAKVKSFRDKLKKARGPNKYLETSRDGFVCLVKSKNPRVKDEDKDKEID